MQKGILLSESKTVCNAVIQLGDIDDTGKGRKFTARFIQPGLVKIEGHGIVLLQKQTLDASLPTIIGSPVIVQHKDITEKNADDLRCGVIANAQYNELDGWYYVDGIIWDEKAIELINKGWSVSCSYDFLAYNDEGGVENNIKYDKEFTQLNFTHLAIVNNPRYERANIVFNCKIDNANSNKYPAGTEGGKGGQFAPGDRRSFENYTYDILKRAQLMAGVENFEASKSGYAVRFTIPESNFRARQKALVQILDKDKKVDFYSFGENASEGRQPIVIQFKKNNKKESEQDNMVLNALKQLIAVVENAKDSDENGRWVTIKGTHVFIPDGKSVDDVMKEKGWDASSTGKKSESYYRQKDDEDLLTKQNEIQKQKEDLLKKLKATDDVAEGDKLLAQIEGLSQKQEQLKQKRLDIDKEAYRKNQDLKGKYERDDVDWDEEQLKKDLKAAQDLGYKEVEDIAEYLGLDEDEVRETLVSSGEKKEGKESDFKFKTDSSYKSKKHPDGIVFDLVGEDELIKGFENASKGQTISKELEDKLSKEMQKYANLPGWSDKFEQMWDEVDDYYDQWKEAGGKKASLSQLFSRDEIDKAFKGATQHRVFSEDFESTLWDRLEKQYPKYEERRDAAMRIMGEMRDEYNKYEKQIQQRFAGKDITPKALAKETGWSLEHAKKMLNYWDDFEQVGKDTYHSNKTNNSKEQDMLLDEIKKLIKRVENNKETEEMVENEKVDKRKLIDEVGGILKDKVDEEVWRTIIGKLEKMSYNESEAGTADNKKVKNEDEEDDKKVDNEDAEDEKEVKEVKEEIKEDVDNKCKNSKSSFDKINEIYNSVKQVEKETKFVSRQQKLDNAVEYFK